MKRTLQVCLLFYLILHSVAYADTLVSGAISTDTVWTLSQSPYIVTGSITIQGTDGDDSVTTLTIEPGVEIRFNGNLFIFIGSTSGAPGAIEAIGTGDSPIMFTSNQATPWNGLYFRNTADDVVSILDHCIIEKTNTYALRIDDAKPTIQNSTIRQQFTVKFKRHQFQPFP